VLYILYPIYNPKPHVLPFHYDNWNEYPEELKKQIHVIMVDDCSKPPIKFKPPLPNYTHMRIKEDIYWNASGTKNLGFNFIPNNTWVFASDIDHILTATDCQKCIDLYKEKNKVYWFRRIKDGKFYKQHANTFLINSDDYMKIGGYDEDFGGNGGYNDTLLSLKMRYYRLRFVNTYINIYLDENLSYTTKDFVKKGVEVNFRKLHNKRKKMLKGTYEQESILNFEWEIVK